jgi:hypothetical protein
MRAAYLLPLLPAVGVAGGTTGFALDAVMQFVLLSLQHKVLCAVRNGVDFFFCCLGVWFLFCVKSV